MILRLPLYAESCIIIHRFALFWSGAVCLILCRNRIMSIEKRGMVRCAMSKASAVAVGLIASGAAWSEPGHVDVGPFKVEPTASTQLSYIDNLYRSPEDETSSMEFELTAAMRAFMQSGGTDFEVNAEITQDWYSESSDDDVTDYSVGFSLDQSLTGQQQVSLSGDFSRSHEDRGSGLSQGGAAGLSGNDAPVEFDTTKFAGSYTLADFGFVIDRLTLDVSNSEKEYVNFKDVTEIFDTDTFDYGAKLEMDLTGKTSVNIAGNWSDIDYPNPKADTASLSAEEFTATVGITWEATGKTTGSISVGYYDREFDDPARPDDDGPRWDASVTWNPKTYTSFTFTSSQTSDGTRGFDVVTTGDYISTENYGVAWNYSFKSGASTSVSWSLGANEYVGSEREDDRTTWRAEYTRELDRWIFFNAGYEYEELDSTDPNLSYDRNMIYFGLDMTL